jgi:hypothetical protein
MWMGEWFSNIVNFFWIWTLTDIYCSNTLINLAKGSKHRILAFEKEANRQLQCSSLSSKLVVRDDIVWECLYMCNQNFDWQKFYHCVAQSNENWMVWDFQQQQKKDITSHVPKFVNVHHVVVKTFQGSQFLQCDCYLYERWVPCCTWIHLLDELIYT